MSAEGIYTALTIVMSLVFDLIPGAKDKWESLPAEAKKWGWWLGCVGVPVGAWGLKCWLNVNPLNLSWACDPTGISAAFSVGFAAYTLSKGVHYLSKKFGGAY